MTQVMIVSMVRRGGRRSLREERVGVKREAWVAMAMDGSEIDEIVSNGGYGLWLCLRESPDLIADFVLEHQKSTRESLSAQDKPHH
ncbi:hypothetical protein F0562_000316 [Nyssa sinensis]|uniref:Uncharacterized protein n=1 Tax=Nyssa sinensis TaxID=561372 RepID=A0A5J5C3Z9_9ASTE|nr:hypothetical protein F0562_000316 [Nyssa sinensis]